MIATETMQIRALTVQELPKCLPLGAAFMAEKQVPGTFSGDVFVKNWTSFLTQFPAVIFGLWKDTELIGGIGGMVFPDLNTGVPAAIEFFWYVGTEHRNTIWSVKLVLRFRKWGRDRGAQRFRMIHLLEPGEDPSTVKLAGFYQKLGLRPIEVSYDGPI